MQSVNVVVVNSSGLRALSDTLPDTETHIRAGDSSRHGTTWKDAAMLENDKFIFISSVERCFGTGSTEQKCTVGDLFRLEIVGAVSHQMNRLTGLSRKWFYVYLTVKGGTLMLLGKRSRGLVLPTTGS